MQASLEAQQSGRSEWRVSLIRCRAWVTQYLCLPNESCRRSRSRPAILRDASIQLRRLVASDLQGKRTVLTAAFRAAARLRPGIPDIPGDLAARPRSLR